MFLDTLLCIIHKQRYIDKTNSLLEDTNNISKNITSLYKLKKKSHKEPKKSRHPSNQDTTLKSQHFMAYSKYTNQTSLLRSIISSIVSSTHKIPRAITKILTPLLGTISPSNSKNSGDLLNKIKDINNQNETVNSLDINSLYTNVPIKNASTFLLLTLEKLHINTQIRICKHITNMTYFKFNNKFYKQTYIYIYIYIYNGSS